MRKMNLNIIILIVIFMSSTRDTKFEEAKRPRMHEFYRNGKLEGERREWYENGNIGIREFYHRGKREGERKTWYGNGQTQIQTFYRHGKRDGIQKCWHESGRIWGREFFKNGMMQGEFKSWGGGGEILTWEFWGHGIAIDYGFTENKKNGFLRIKRHLRKNIIHLLYVVLISDLAKMI